MSNYIILRNIPKFEATIDMMRIPIQGGFRGFERLNRGIHYVSIENLLGKHTGFWYNFNGHIDEKEVIVKTYNDKTHCLEDDSEENRKHYTRLAISRAMKETLVRPPENRVFDWTYLVHFIKKINYFPELHLLEKSAIINSSTYFDELYNGIHGGDDNKLMAEFQWAFMRYFVSTLSDIDTEALLRWQQIVQIMYNASEEQINNSGILFVSFISFFLRQFQTLPENKDLEFNMDGELNQVIIKGARQFINKLINSPQEAILQAGNKYRRYFRERNVLPQIMAME